MIEPGKNFPGEKGFPTPNEVPEERGYLVFRFPQSNEFAGLLLGAANLLTSEYNYFKWGGLFPDEAALLWDKIVEVAPYDTCGCEIPGNVPVFHLNGAGEWEQLVDGEWLPPLGEWTIPPPEPREEATDFEKRCLASANAANVLKLMYESLTDSISESLTQDEAMTALSAAVAGALLVPVMGEIMLALYALATFLMAEAFVIAEFLTADLWTEDFDNEFVCILLNNSTVGLDGVVVFDITQVTNDVVNALAFDLDLTLGQQRLALQVGYMLQMIGAQGLNIAGGTTGVSSFDCDVCDLTWCRHQDLAVEDGGWSADFGSWVDGTGWVRGCLGGIFGVLAFRRQFDPPVQLDSVYLSANTVLGTTGGEALPINVYGYLETVEQFHEASSTATGVMHPAWAGATTLVDEVYIEIFTSRLDCSGSTEVFDAIWTGHGENPFGEDNCE